MMEVELLYDDECNFNIRSHQFSCGTSQDAPLRKEISVNPHNAEIFLYKPCRQNFFFQFEFIIL